MTLIALAGLLSAGLHGGPRPGLHVRVGGIEVGLCRDDAGGRSRLPDGRAGGHRHQFGVWRAVDGELVAGASSWDGRLVVRANGANHLIW